jgi:predicted lactoylglutathione lyase
MKTIQFKTKTAIGLNSISAAISTEADFIIETGAQACGVSKAEAIRQIVYAGINALYGKEIIDIDGELVEDAQ